MYALQDRMWKSLGNCGFYSLRTVLFSDQLRIPEIKYVIPLLSNINFSEPGKKRGSFFVDYKLAYCSI